MSFAISAWIYPYDPYLSCFRLRSILRSLDDNQADMEKVMF
jgi:hypothetical protein